MPTQDQCENRGRTVTEEIVSAEAIHNWQEFDQQNDDGVDGMILINNKNNVKTGEIVFTQVKGGQKGRGYYTEAAIRPNHIGLNLGQDYIERHLPRWYNVPGPMILVFVEYDSRMAYWTDLRDPNSYSGTNKSIILVDKRKRFGKHSFGEFKKLKGYTHISQEIDWVEISLDDTNYLNLEKAISIKNQAKEFYNIWKASNAAERMNPELGEVIISRVGWRHITRKKRKKSRIIQSFQLLGVAKQIIKQTKKIWQVKKLKEEITSDGTLIITDFLGLRGRVKFTFRNATVVQVLLKRKKFINEAKGIYRTEIRFYSVYEPFINRDI